VRSPGKRDRSEKQEEAPATGTAITSSADLRAGDRVVYPKQGVYRVTGLEQKDIAGQRLEFVKMVREEDGAAVLVPLAKVPSIGLRRVASADDIEGVFHYLGASYDDPELDWKVRHRDNVERLIAGGVLGVAEVVKGLHSLARLRPLPAKERELYDSSRHLLVNEISVSLSVPDVVAEDYVDYALMPPAGVKLPLKPPPTPVELKGPPWKRKKPAASEDDDDLGLGDLGIDLGNLEGVGADAEGEGEEEQEGEREEGSAEGGEEAAEAPARPEKKGAAVHAKGAAASAKAPARAAPAAPPAPAKAAAKAPAPRPEKRPAPAKAPAKAAKPAAKAAPKKPAAKPERKPAAKAPARPAAKPAAKKAPAKKPAKGKKK
jgi:RNA polymerase-interacting CarD/CdnL/TRCF family regulator